MEMGQAGAELPGSGQDIELLQRRLDGMAEENRRLRSQLREAHSQNRILVEQLDQASIARDIAVENSRQAWTQLSLLRGSQSWKLTAPTRYVKQLLRF